MVRLLLRQVEAQQGHDGGPGVREVVHGVGHHGDGPGGQARQQLAQKEQQVEAHAHRAAEDPIALPHLGLRLSLRFEEHPGQHGNHIISSPRRNLQIAQDMRESGTLIPLPSLPKRLPRRPTKGLEPFQFLGAPGLGSGETPGGASPPSAGPRPISSPAVPASCGSTGRPGPGPWRREDGAWPRIPGRPGPRRTAGPPCRNGRGRRRR